MLKIRQAAVVFIAIAALSGCCGNTGQADYGVIPKPQSMEPGSGGEVFTLDKKTTISWTSGDGRMENTAELLKDYIMESTGIETRLTDSRDGNSGIVLSTGYESENPEAYHITIDGGRIEVEGASEAGVFYGVQFLRKSLPTMKCSRVTFPEATVTDFPRFGYRGGLFDTCRYFYTVDEVKTFIDMLAMHNMNKFHWHLNDDQGWRIEIQKYPKLTEIGSMRKETVIGHKDNPQGYDGTPHGGFYTQDEIRDIVDYAAKRFITIIPEIDLPGHMQAALAAYPELGCTGGPYEVATTWGVSDQVLCVGKDKTYTFITDILTEVLDLFPSEYIHIGGDECPKTEWEKCPACQAKIRELGLKDDSKFTKEEYLQSYVTHFVEDFLTKHGRRIIGWDEILDGGLSPDVTVMYWRGWEGDRPWIEATSQHHDVIMCPTDYFYFDYYQSEDRENEPLGFGGYVPVEKVYGYEPVSPKMPEDEKQYIIGVQANLWTEYIKDFKHAQYMALPRFAAASEVQWTMPEKKDYADFLDRLPHLASLYDLCGYTYAKHVFGQTEQE